jgi:predicted histone-like DNA-binding protein
MSNYKTIKTMGTIQIKKVERVVTVGKQGEQRQRVQKTYGKIIYRGTLTLTDMAEHVMKHGSVYTEDVVVGVITKLKHCIQEMLADGYKVKLDGIGTLYPVLTSQGVADAKDFSASENITRVGIAFLADQSKRSTFKASAMRQDTTLSTRLYTELAEEGENNNPEPSNPNNPSPNSPDNPSPDSPEGEGSQNGGNTGNDNGGNTGGGSGQN